MVKSSIKGRERGGIASEIDLSAGVPGTALGLRTPEGCVDRHRDLILTDQFRTSGSIHPSVEGGLPIHDGGLVGHDLGLFALADSFEKGTISHRELEVAVLLDAF